MGDFVIEGTRPKSQDRPVSAVRELLAAANQRPPEALTVASVEDAEMLLAALLEAIRQAHEAAAKALRAAEQVEKSRELPFRVRMIGATDGERR